MFLAGGFGIQHLMKSVEFRVAAILNNTSLKPLEILYIFLNMCYFFSQKLLYALPVGTGDPEGRK